MSPHATDEITDVAVSNGTSNGVSAAATGPVDESKLNVKIAIGE